MVNRLQPRFRNVSLYLKDTGIVIKFIKNWNILQR